MAYLVIHPDCCYILETDVDSTGEGRVRNITPSEGCSDYTHASIY